MSDSFFSDRATLRMVVLLWFRSILLLIDHIVTHDALVCLSGLHRLVLYVHVRFRFYLKLLMLAWFSVEYAVTSNREEKKTFTTRIEIQADSGHVLSLSAVLLLYPSGLIADSCYVVARSFLCDPASEHLYLFSTQQIQIFKLRTG